MNQAKWINYFTRNRTNRPEPDWAAPLNIPPQLVPHLIKSLENFRLGEGSGPVSVDGTGPQRFPGCPGDLNAIVRLWFREEAEHARLLGCAVKRLGGEFSPSQWSSSLFRLCRRALGFQFKLQVLLHAELVGTAYYRILEARVPDEPIAQVCRLIMRDESSHVAFHRERLAEAGRSSLGIKGALWQSQFWFLAQAMAMIVWLNHGRCLNALGSSRQEYFEEVARDLRRFILSLDRLIDSQSERLRAPAATRTARFKIPCPDISTPAS